MDKRIKDIRFWAMMAFVVFGLYMPDEGKNILLVSLWLFFVTGFGDDIWSEKSNQNESLNQ